MACRPFPKPLRRLSGKRYANSGQSVTKLLMYATLQTFTRRHNIPHDNSFPFRCDGELL